MGVTTMKAIYRDGTFVPREPCGLPEGAEVEIIVQGVPMLPAAVTDPVERQRILQALTARMKRHPLPPEAPRFTRAELHDRG